MEARKFCMFSLDPELLLLFFVLMSTTDPFGSQNGSTPSIFHERNLETLFHQHESKLEHSHQYFADIIMCYIISATFQKLI